MARNANRFTNENSLGGGVESEKVVKEILADADLKTASGKGKGGRKPKEVKSDKLIRVYITSEQKESLEAYCKKTGVTESFLVRQLLTEKEIIKTL